MWELTRHYLHTHNFRLASTVAVVAVAVVLAAQVRSCRR
jgi:hypothetical protein